MSNIPTFGGIQISNPTPKFKPGDITIRDCLYGKYINKILKVTEFKYHFQQVKRLDSYGFCNGSTSREVIEIMDNQSRLLTDNEKIEHL